MRNLHAQLEGIERRAAQGRVPSQVWVDRIDLLALRGEFLGRIADYERAAELAEDFVSEAPADGLAFATRARTHSTFHHFADALDDLDRAAQLGVPAASLIPERAAILHQLGRSDQALNLAQEAANHRPDFTTLAALAVLHAERRDVDAAEVMFAASRAHYRTVSPFPLAQLDFQRGRMWLSQGQHRRARGSLEAAVTRVPAYAPAQGHLAETEAALGECNTAIARLRPLADSTDDPDYAAQLARILCDAGEEDEAQSWRDRAATRYEELIAHHSEAYADHAAEFWLGVGGNPQRALQLARLNVEARPTPRALDIVARASLASQATFGASSPPIHRV
jgi:tetratricopeptide (TPR) repeat protein